MSSLGDAIARAPADDLAADLRDMIRYAASVMPRNTQQALGPSEIGHPCPRKLAYGLMAEPGDGGYDDPLASLIGTAFHKWLEWAAEQHNIKLGYERWIPERRVSPWDGLEGTCDLYDNDTDTVIDHKVPGTTRFKKYTVGGPSPTYRGQAQMYGAGYVRLGKPVKNVAIHWIPRASAQLSGTRIWMEPYNPQMVQQIHQRVDDTTLLIEALQLEHNPAGYKVIPIVPDEDCRLCAYWNPVPDDNPFHCVGNADVPPPPGLFDAH